MKSIAGMSILITGGGSGIGRIARDVSANGGRVTISGRRVDKRAVQAELGAQCEIVQGDVTVQADRETMLTAALHHGDGNLHPHQQRGKHVSPTGRWL